MVAYKLVSIKFLRMEFSQIFQLKWNKELVKHVVPVVVIIGNCATR